VLDARVLQPDLGHAPDHGIGAIERRGVGQLREGDQVLLVLRRHEARGHAPEGEEGQEDEPEVAREHEALVADRAADAARVAAAGGLEDTVEGPEEPAQQGVEHARDPVARLVVAAQEQSRQRGRERQRVERRDHGRDRDRDRELLVEAPGQAADEGRRDEHRAEHQRRGHDRSRDLLHRLLRRLQRRLAQAYVALDVLDDHDRVVHDDPDRQHQSEERERVDAEAEGVHGGKGADQRDRHGGQRDQRGAPGLQEDDHHDHDQHDRLEQGLDHGLDRLAHEDRRVVDDAVLQACGEGLGDLGQLGAHVARELQRVGARRLEDRQRHRDLVVQQRAHRVARGAELDARDVREVQLLPLRTDLDDDLLELALLDEPPLRGQLRLEGARAGERRLADRARRDLRVLGADRRDHVAGHQAARGELVRVEPDPHGELADGEDLHVADAGDARQLVLDLQPREVPEIGLVVAAVARDQVRDHRQVGRLLGRRHTQRAHLLGQTRQRLRDAVLHLHLRLVDVGAEREGHGQRQRAVAGRLRGHVERVLDAVDRLLERRGDCLGDRARVRAGVGGAHDDRGRHDLGILADRQAEERDRAQQQDQEREHAGEDRAADEELGEVHLSAPRSRPDPG
jgi:hypothetical protein